MRSILAFAGLVAFLVVAVLVHLNLKDAKNEQLIIGWSNSLIWSALRTQAAPNYLYPTLDEAENEGHWQVAGDVEFRDADGAPVQHAYRAIIAQTCLQREQRECWRLASLEVGGAAVDLANLDQGAVDQGAVDQATPGPADASVVEGMSEDGVDREAGAASPERTAPVAAAASPGAEAAGSAIEGVAAPAADVPAPDGVPLVAEPLDQRTLVLRIQQRLIALGFDPGVPDGQLGPKTMAAIRAYQASRGVAAEGVPSLQQLRDLESQ